jgi:hypothetical protein
MVQETGEAAATPTEEPSQIPKAEAGEAAIEPTAGPQVPEVKQVYDLHTRVPAERQQLLRDCAELAYRMGDIPKARTG